MMNGDDMCSDKNQSCKDKWYTRPIFSVADIEKSLNHYCELLDFTQSWAYEEDGRTIVTQVNRGDFELILTENLDRVGKARVFISLEDWELENLQQQIEAKEISFEQMFWGYPTIKVADPDGNEMFFPFNDEDSS